MMKVLVVTSEPISSDHLREALGNGVTEDADVMVVAPALHTSALRFWMSDADEAIARAEHVERKTVEQLEHEGISAVGDTGESDILEAAEDALKTFPASRILLFAHPHEEERYREDIAPETLAEALGLPVDRLEIKHDAAEPAFRSAT